jgi:hypothetical protein
MRLYTYKSYELIFLSLEVGMVLKSRDGYGLPSALV